MQSNTTSSSLYVIGCGGVGSWLAPSLCMLVGPRYVNLVDGDTLEEKNLNRQLFDEDDIGTHKSRALGLKYHCAYETDWYHAGSFSHDKTDWVFCCADNHRCRQQVLAACDIHGCRAIVACNEKHSAEAFYYQPDWKETNRDPRIYYPEISTDRSGDPMAASIGCTGEAQVETPQLVSANFMAAALAQHLYVIWGMEARKMERETLPHLPYRISSTLTRLSCERVGE